MINIVLAVVLGLTAACIGAAGSHAQQSTSKLRYGQIAASARSITSLPLYVAERKGMLARERIELEVAAASGIVSGCSAQAAS